MRALLLGANGQVGWELQRSLAPMGAVYAADRTRADLEASGQLVKLVAQVQPDVIVNAAAHTAVDRAESEADRVHAINAEAPGLLARLAAERGAMLVHYSTDYVFDGSGSRPWAEDDPTGPLSVYGRTKLAGEDAIRASGAKHLIFRTSWVYASRGGNFARTMLRLGAERELLRVIDDQIGAPTGADLIADVTAHALRQAMAQGTTGTYHLAPAGQTSWHGYAQFVFEAARRLKPDLPLKVQTVEAIPTTAYPTPAQRPLNSRLDTTRLQATFGLQLPHWQTGVLRMLHETL
ncbi:dTDP-4-dehydrorhamnose reductase [uncultured Hydrogenophaga sp.]|uniref:dTDP-4-dehydrorhamnose reductase n=1 Tax=uncultured Hydrogenophaga sp. TaxID=199683 RepID=UPI00265E6CC2|nr:dTDP-4-dehydrorhamnose reductase [uncultured Hydrogenophaga sp.]